MFRNDDGMHGPKRGRGYEKQLIAQRATVPERPQKGGPGRRENQSFFFTQHVMKNREIDNSRVEDPRAALLAQDSAAKADPSNSIFGRAYQHTQPETKLHTETFEEEKQNFKKKQKTDIAGF